MNKISTQSVSFEVMEWTGKNYDILDFCGPKARIVHETDVLGDVCDALMVFDDTIGGEVLVPENYYIMKGGGKLRVISNDTYKKLFSI